MTIIQMLTHKVFYPQTQRLQSHKIIESLTVKFKWLFTRLCVLITICYYPVLRTTRQREVKQIECPVSQQRKMSTRMILLCPL